MSFEFVQQQITDSTDGFIIAFDGDTFHVFYDGIFVEDFANMGLAAAFIAVATSAFGETAEESEIVQTGITNELKMASDALKFAEVFSDEAMEIIKNGKASVSSDLTKVIEILIEEANKRDE